MNGNLDLNGSPNQAADSTTSQTAGQYSKIRYSATRQQVITESVSIFGSLTGQQSSKNLDSSEKLYLGGAYGVRAYPTNEGGGSEGQLADLELRWRLPQGFTFTGFYDYGQITVNQNNNFTGSSNINSYALKGAGLSLAWQSRKNFTLKASYSRRIGDNPNPSATGTDQDGSFVRDRLWLWATFPFSFNGSSSASKNSEIVATPIVELSTVVSVPSVISAPVIEKIDLASSTSAPILLPQALGQSKSEKPRITEPIKLPIAQPQGPPPTIESFRAQSVVTGLQFKANSAKLLPSSEAELDGVLKVALANPTDVIDVSGHTDKSKLSNQDFNIRLSQQRANTIKNYLLKHRVAADKVVTRGFGFSKPIASNTTIEGRTKNRRVEIRFIPIKANASVAENSLKEQL